MIKFSASPLGYVQRANNRAAGVNAFFSVAITGAALFALTLIERWTFPELGYFVAVELGMSGLLFAAAGGQALWVSRGIGQRALFGGLAAAAYAGTGLTMLVAVWWQGAGGIGAIDPMSWLVLASLVPASIANLGAGFGQAAVRWDASPLAPARGIVRGAVIGAVLCGLAILALPPMPANRQRGNESSAIGSLRALTTAQEQFRSQVLVDQDGDGIGEYGRLAELAGTGQLRGSTKVVSDWPFIAQVLGQTDALGLAQKSGYTFIVYLPTAGPSVLGANPNWTSRELRARPSGPTPPIAAAPANKVDADAQEARWCAYAWPTSARQTGRRAFFTDHAGEVYATAMDKLVYSGTTSIPKPDAAFVTGSGTDLDGGVGLAAAKLTSNDGNTWVPAGN